ncbi:MAG TPA: hypothetical protein VJT72_21565 [Pseudonocardiaceae bacterium]|nr:hypothetical protein [Pseudonocardiaceae bacterium]
MSAPRLSSPDCWPAAAEQLVAAGDRGALRDLVAAYDSPVEGSRRSLLKAMRALGGVAEATRLASSPDAVDRRLAARLMHLLPDEHHLSSLESLVADPEITVATAARRAMRGQRRTHEWHAAVDRLTHAESPALRDAAADWLAESAG